MKDTEDLNSLVKRLTGLSDDEIKEHHENYDKHLNNASKEDLLKLHSLARKATKLSEEEKNELTRLQIKCTGK